MAFDVFHPLGGDDVVHEILTATEPNGDAE
jgi:hypothetical protein